MLHLVIKSSSSVVELQFNITASNVRKCYGGKGKVCGSGMYMTMVI